jgi:Fe-S-cluster containining protein
MCQLTMQQTAMCQVHVINPEACVISPFLIALKKECQACMDGFTKHNF